MKDKKVKRIVLIIGILILLILLGVFVFGLFKRSIINKPYIVFGRINYSSPSDMVGYNREEYFYYYINEDGYVVQSNISSSGNEKNSLIRKISQEEVKELEQYIINEVERLDNNIINEDSRNIVWIDGKVVSNDEGLIINLINKITE